MALVNALMASSALLGPGGPLGEDSGASVARIVAVWAQSGQLSQSNDGGNNYLSPVTDKGLLTFAAPKARG